MLRVLCKLNSTKSPRIKPSINTNPVSDPPTLPLTVWQISQELDKGGLDIYGPFQASKTFRHGRAKDPISETGSSVTPEISRILV